MTFIQIIQFRTKRLEEFNALLDNWLEESKGWRTSSQAMQCRDRDQPDTYINIVQFPSHEAAMANSDRPETGAFAERLAELCDGPPTFRNFDLLRQVDM